MKFKNYILACQEMIKENPEIGELECLSASDDEGNSYQKVRNLPSPCIVDDLNEYFIDSVWYIGADKIDEDYNKTGEKIELQDCNAIVIN